MSDATDKAGQQDRPRRDSFEFFTFLCQVLETPLGVRDDHISQNVCDERKAVQKRYRQLAGNHPDWRFCDCSLMARAEWLRDYLARRFNEPKGDSECTHSKTTTTN